MNIDQLKSFVTKGIKAQKEIDSILDGYNNKKHFQLVRDCHGYACAISHGGIFVLHFQTGTERNEKNAQKIVDLLNRSKATEKEIKALREVKLANLKKD